MEPVLICFFFFQVLFIVCWHKCLKPLYGRKVRPARDGSSEVVLLIGDPGLFPAPIPSSISAPSDHSSYFFCMILFIGLVGALHPDSIWEYISHSCTRFDEISCFFFFFVKIKQALKILYNQISNYLL